MSSSGYSSTSYSPSVDVDSYALGVPGSREQYRRGRNREKNPAMFDSDTESSEEGSLGPKFKEESPLRSPNMYTSPYSRFIPVTEEAVDIYDISNNIALSKNTSKNTSDEYYRRERRSSQSSSHSGSHDVDVDTRRGSNPQAFYSRMGIPEPDYDDVPRGASQSAIEDFYDAESVISHSIIEDQESTSRTCLLSSPYPCLIDRTTVPPYSWLAPRQTCKSTTDILHPFQDEFQDILGWDLWRMSELPKLICTQPQWANVLHTL